MGVSEVVVMQFSEVFVPEKTLFFKNGKFRDVILSPKLVSVCQARAKKWLDFKGNQANLFGGDYESKLAGLLGEEGFRELLEREGIVYERHVIDGEADKFDFVINGKVVSVKTTNAWLPPKQNARVLVNARQRKNRTDFFAFLWRQKNTVRVVFLGVLSEAEFFSRAEIHKQGEPMNKHKDKADVPRYVSDCYSIGVRALKPIETLKQ